MRRPGLEPSTASKHKPRSIETLNSPFRRNASKRSIEPTCPHSANLSTSARSASPHLDAANHSCRRNANRLTPPSSSSRRREARHQAIDLPTKPESVLTISIDWPAEAHIEQFVPAVIEPACRASVRTDPLSTLRRRRTVDPLHQASACAVQPELSPAGLGWFACGAFSLPAVLHRPGRGSRLRAVVLNLVCLHRRTAPTPKDESHFKPLRESREDAFVPASEASYRTSRHIAEAEKEPISIWHGMLNSQWRHAAYQQSQDWAFAQLRRAQHVSFVLPPLASVTDSPPAFAHVARSPSCPTSVSPASARVQPSRLALSTARRLSNFWCERRSL
jgi:hypothetical protein